MDLGPYVGGHFPPTELEKIERYAIDQCRGDAACPGEYHIHGCFKPHASNKCDSPAEYGHIDTPTP